MTAETTLWQRMVLSLRAENAPMSQKEFGALFGVTRQAVSSWESGRAAPRHSVLELMAEKAGLTVSELVKLGE